jgi:hypothetical protein
MRPEFTVSIKHVEYLDELDKIVEWVNANIGPAYPFDEEASYPRIGWDKPGKWACIAMSNRYTGSGRDMLLDTWWFADRDDAALFALRWS